jgi:hypothetical protein
MERQELLKDRLRLETDGMRVRANEGTAKYPYGPMRDVVSLQTLQQRHFDFRLLGNRREGNLLLLTALTQSGAEGLGHVVCHLAKPRYSHPQAIVRGPLKTVGGSCSFEAGSCPPLRARRRPVATGKNRPELTVPISASYFKIELCHSARRAESRFNASAVMLDVKPNSEVEFMHVGGGCANDLRRGAVRVAARLAPTKLG